MVICRIFDSFVERSPSRERIYLFISDQSTSEANFLSSTLRVEKAVSTSSALAQKGNKVKPTKDMKI